MGINLSEVGVFQRRCFVVLSNEMTFSFETQSGVMHRSGSECVLGCSVLVPGLASVWTDGQEGFMEACRTPLTPPPARDGIMPIQRCRSRHHTVNICL